MDRTQWLQEKRGLAEQRYHYYPLIEQVRAWTLAARFNIIEEAVGDDYHHFIVRRAEPAGRYDR